MEFISLFYLFIGLAFGYLIAYFRVKDQYSLTKEEAETLEQRKEEALQQLSRLEERNTILNNQLKTLEREKRQCEQQAHESEKQLSARNADYRNLKERLDEQKVEMRDLQGRFKEEFENLANNILEEKSKKFTEQNKQKLDQLLKPLGKKMEEFKQQVEETHKEDIKGRSSLKQHLEQLKDLNHQMAQEAKDLTRALKGDSQTQGSWGEVILQRILEKSGLTKGREYEIQQHHVTDAGRRLQPDVVVHLPDNKRLIVDSKVSLTAYERLSSAEDDVNRQQALKEHVQSLRKHVKGLSRKNYQQLYGGNSPDFVLLFVPIESAFGVALQQDSKLYYDAFDQNIVIVSPSTLLATLATIDSVWKQEYQTKNALEIAERGGKLYDKFVNFVESLQKIGDRIRQAQQEYDTAMGRLTNGHGNVIRQVEMLRELGASATKRLPEDLSEAGPTEIEPKQQRSTTNGTTV